MVDLVLLLLWAGSIVATGYSRTMLAVVCVERALFVCLSWRRYIVAHLVKRD